MSDIMERTLASLPRLLGGGGRKGAQGATQGKSTPPPGLQALLKAVDNVRSHAEEREVVRKELALCKQQLEQPGATAAQWREGLPRVVFCSALGYDVTFSHVYALKLAALGKGQDKRAGYLTATLLLDPSMEVTILIMGTIQKDLHSSNMMDNFVALGAAAELMGPEGIPYMLPKVVTLLRHRHAMVRERAVHCLQSYFRRAPSLLRPTLPQLQGMLGDRDPGVLRALVTLFASLVERSPAEFTSLGGDLLNILQQVRARKFPAAYSYHGIPLPWLQMLLLKTLAELGCVTPDLAARLLPTLSQVMSEANSKETISLAVLNQSLLTIATLANSCRASPSLQTKPDADTHQKGSAVSQEKDTEDSGVVVREAGGGALCDSVTGGSNEGLYAGQRAPGAEKGSASSSGEGLYAGEGTTGAEKGSASSSGEGLYAGQGTTGAEKGSASSSDRGGQEKKESHTNVTLAGSDGSGGYSEREALWVRLEPLLLEASRCVARFLGSGVPNLRLVGVVTLARLVSVSAPLAAHHQGAVVQCLDDPDPGVRRQTLTLLHHMANRANAAVVVAKMMERVTTGSGEEGGGGCSGLMADVADMVVDIAGRLSPSPQWYLRTLLPLLSLRCLDPGRASALTDTMLRFFAQVTRDPARWPDFPQCLFETMVKVVRGEESQSSSSRGSKLLRFAVKVLRFVPMTGGGSAADREAGGGFLSACDRVMGVGVGEREGEEEEGMEEEVVLCVQQLMVTGRLGRQDVARWVRSRLAGCRCDRSTTTTPPQSYRTKLAQLLALASLPDDSSDLSSLALSPLSLHDDRREKELDFTLSFMDSYAAETVSKGRPLFQARRCSASLEPGPFGTALVDASSMSVTFSPGSNNSSSPRLSGGDGGGGVLYADSSLGSSSSLGGSTSVQSPQEGIPAARRVWTSEGFVGDAVKPSASSASAGVEGRGLKVEGQQANVAAGPRKRDQHSATPESRFSASPDKVDEKEELAKALFQGLSPPSSTSFSSSRMEIPQLDHSRTQDLLGQSLSLLTSPGSAVVGSYDPNVSTTDTSRRSVGTDELFSVPPNSTGARRPDSLAGAEASFQSLSGGTARDEGLPWSAQSQSQSQSNPSDWRAVLQAHSNPRVTEASGTDYHPPLTSQSVAIETSQTDRQSSTTTTTSQSSATVLSLSEHVFSDMGSGSSLSISDDSLENLRDLSNPNSPAKRAFPGAKDPELDRTLVFESGSDSGLPGLLADLYTTDIQGHSANTPTTTSHVDVEGESAIHRSEERGDDEGETLPVRTGEDGVIRERDGCETSRSRTEDSVGGLLYEGLGESAETENAAGSELEESGGGGSLYSGLEESGGGGSLYSGLEESGGGGSLYSGFEDLTLYAGEWQLEEEDEEQAEQTRLETDIVHAAPGLHSDILS